MGGAGNLKLEEATWGGKGTGGIGNWCVGQM